MPHDIAAGTEWHFPGGTSCSLYVNKAMVGAMVMLVYARLDYTPKGSTCFTGVRREEHLLSPVFIKIIFSTEQRRTGSGG